jgi:hypothetical protein
MSSIYPGFTLQQFFERPAIIIPKYKSNTLSTHFSGGTVEFNYNSYGYRTEEFNKQLNNYILIGGCSLTEGHGLHLTQTWGKKLEQRLNKSVVNLAKGGANAEFVSQNLINWISSDFINPIAVIAQWPNPYRATHWNNELAQFILNQTADDVYKSKIKQGQEHFYIPWIQNIIRLNTKCKELNIPILHLCFETPESINPALNILQQYKIDLQLDLKLPERTWYFDHSALDGIHHSEWCSEQWTKRILTLMDNVL